jgi:hypothetical protein
MIRPEVHQRVRHFLQSIRRLLHFPMKALLSIALVLILSGCAEDTPPAQEVRDQFERGLGGQGHIVPIDRPDDPATRPASTFPDSN